MWTVLSGSLNVGQTEVPLMARWWRIHVSLSLFHKLSLTSAHIHSLIHKFTFYTGGQKIDTTT